MDEGNTKCEENARYSFLLGSALRNEDTEQFLQIYDAILPTEISPELVDRIKEAARKVADLEVEDFSQLVSQARHFSVAAPVVPTRMTSSSGDDMRKEVMEDEVITGRGLGQVKRPSGPCTTWKASGAGHEGASEGETAVEETEDHGDSGVFNSSKNTTGSMSDDAEIEELERRGVMYFPPDSKPQLTKHKLRNVDVQRKNNAAYDAVECVVDSDAEEQSQPIDDELSEVVTIKNEEIEMKTIRTYRSQDDDCENFYLRQQNDNTRMRNNLQYDEAVTVPDDDDPMVQHYTTSAHEHLDILGRKFSHFTPMHQEEKEEYNAETPEPVVHARFRGNPMRGYPVLYPNNARTSISGIKSDGVQIQRDVRQRGGSMRTQPPFGDPVNLDRLCASSSSLMESRLSSDVCNMPRAERIGMGRSLNRSQERDIEGNNTDNSSKKKKKKKRNTKDEGGGDKEAHDENGNPMENIRHRPENRYPSSNLPVTVDRKQVFPRRPEEFGSYELNGRPISDMEDSMTSGTSASDQPKKKTRVTRRKENELRTSVKSESIDGYQGEKSVDELVGIIENISNSSSSSNSGNKKKKKVSGNLLPNGNAEGNLTNGPVNGDVIKTVKKVKPGNKTKASSLPKDFEKCSNIVSDRTEETSQKNDEKKEVDNPIAETKKSVPVPRQQNNNEPAKPVNSKVYSENFDMKDIEDNAMFIFTDFENVLPLPEEEFKVVTRKKPTRTLPMNPQVSTAAFTKDYSKDTHHNYDNSYNSGYGAHSIQNSSDSTSDFLRTKDDRMIREERSSSHRRSRPTVRSVTPPPTSSSHSTDEYYPEKPPVERAFSPSAFPALGGMREGRRNSTGNVPSESTPDDSDIESVKSLPLVAASRASNTKVEGVISPIVSYAKIAAGPKTAGKIAVVAGSTSVSAAGKEEKNAEPDSDEVEITRRHSLSSVTDSNVPEEDPLPAPVSVAHTASRKDTNKFVTDIVTPKPKSLSVEKVVKTQERLVQTVEAKEKVIDINNQPQSKNIKLDATAISSVGNNEGSIKNTKVEVTTNNTKSVTSGYSPQMPYCDNKQHQEFIFGIAPIPGINDQIKGMLPTDPPSILNNTDFPPISELSTAKTGTSTTAATPFPSAAAVTAASVTVVSHAGKPHTPVGNIPPSPRDRHQLNPQSQSPSTTTTSSTITSTNPLQNNLNKTPVVSNNNKKQKNKSVVFLDNKRSQSSHQSLGISFGFDTNLNFMTGVNDGPGVVTMAVSEIKDNADSKPGTHGLNGIVPALYDMVPTREEKPTQNSAVTENSAATSTTDSLTVIEDTTAMQAAITNMPSKPSDTPQKLCAPEAVDKAVSEASSVSELAKGASEGHTDNNKRLINLQNLVPQNRALDPNYVRGRFSVEDAVSHMKTEWDQIMDMKNKNPAKVIFYSSQ